MKFFFYIFVYRIKKDKKMWAAEAKAKKNIPLKKFSNLERIFGAKIDQQHTVKKGNSITITKGVKCKYAIWHHSGIWDLPEEYVNESSIKIISED